jgi:lycopene cyclase domain-containing protein
MYTYLLLNIVSIAYPLYASFDKRIDMVKNWLAIFLALAITGAGFIIWDVYFTANGVWSFNDTYILGIKIWGLPIEEIMFFFFIPYACIFIYEVVKYFFRFSKDYMAYHILTGFLIGFFYILGFANSDKSYTFYVSILTATALLVHYLLYGISLLKHFYIAYLFHLIPFFAVNGLLTYIPVVIYNNAENLSLRIFTVPMEDTIYSMLLLLINISLFENFKKILKPKVSLIS